MNSQTMCRPATTCVAETSEERGSCQYRPDVDIVENADEFTIHADMPGVAAGDVDVSFEKGTLAIRGRVQRRPSDGATFLTREYGVGDYHREFSLGNAIAADRIEARFADGVLTLRLPKVDTVKARRIEVATS